MMNILDKTDKSLAPTPRANGQPTMSIKRVKFDWSQGGKPGHFRMIHKAQLNIDGRYQRDQVSDNKVREIARNWDWVLLGVILVVQRDDGSLWVFDGGHRTRAAFYRDDIDSLPCMVYQLEEISNESRAFLGKNLMTTNVSSVDKYKASVCAEDETAIATQEILKEFGVEVSFNATSSRQLKCINTLQKMVDKNESLAKRCFVFMMARTEGSPVSSVCLRGLFALCIRFANEFDVLEKYGEKLARHSQKEMEVRIRQMRAECGKGGEKVEALALMSLINKGCRHKLTWT